MDKTWWHSNRGLCLTNTTNMGRILVKLVNN